MFKYSIKLFLRGGSVQMIPSYVVNLETCEEVEKSLTPAHPDDNTWLKFNTEGGLLKIRYRDISAIEITR